MRLNAPCISQDFATQDIYGQPVKLSELRGRRVLLSFFRDAACPFCSFRIHELTHRYRQWQAQGLEVVAVFSSSDQDVRQHVSRHPRPFRMIADPDLSLYGYYGVEESISGHGQGGTLPFAAHRARHAGRWSAGPEKSAYPTGAGRLSDR